MEHLAQHQIELSKAPYLTVKSLAAGEKNFRAQIRIKEAQENYANILRRLAKDEELAKMWGQQMENSPTFFTKNKAMVEDWFNKDKKKFHTAKMRASYLIKLVQSITRELELDKKYHKRKETWTSYYKKDSGDGKLRMRKNPLSKLF